MILDPPYANVTGQSPGTQSYMPTLGFPASPPPASQTGAIQPVGMPTNNSYPSSYPNTGASGQNPYGNTAASQSSNPSDFSSSPQAYQWPSPGGQSCQFNNSSPVAATGYANYAPPITGQPSEVNGAANVSNNYAPGYYNPGYYGGYYSTK